MPEPVDHEPHLRRRHLRGVARRDGAAGLEPQESFGLHDLEPIGLGQTPEKRQHPRFGYGLAHPEGDAALRQVAIDDVEFPRLSESRDHQPEVGVLEVHQHPLFSDPDGLAQVGEGRPEGRRGTRSDVQRWND